MGRGEGRGAIAFRGRIDRIDLSRDGRRLRVIDYKAGKAEARPDTIRGGRALQLPVYLLAARALASGRTPRPVASESRYLYVTRRGGFKSVAYNDAPGREDALRQAVGLMVEGIAAGRFEAEPEETACRRCDYVRICGSARTRLAELKEHDAARRPFEELREIE